MDINSGSTHSSPSKGLGSEVSSVQHDSPLITPQSPQRPKGIPFSELTRKYRDARREKKRGYLGASGKAKSMDSYQYHMPLTGTSIGTGHKVMTGSTTGPNAPGHMKSRSQERIFALTGSISEENVFEVSRGDMVNTSGKHAGNTRGVLRKHSSADQLNLIGSEIPSHGQDQGAYANYSHDTSTGNISGGFRSAEPSYYSHKVPHKKLRWQVSSSGDSEPSMDVTRDTEMTDLTSPNSGGSDLSPSYGAVFEMDPSPVPGIDDVHGNDTLPYIPHIGESSTDPVINMNGDTSKMSNVGKLPSLPSNVGKVPSLPSGQTSEGSRKPMLQRQRAFNVDEDDNSSSDNDLDCDPIKNSPIHRDLDSLSGIKPNSPKGAISTSVQYKSDDSYVPLWTSYVPGNRRTNRGSKSLDYNLEGTSPSRLSSSPGMDNIPQFQSMDIGANKTTQVIHKPQDVRPKQTYTEPYVSPEVIILNNAQDHVPFSSYKSKTPSGVTPEHKPHNGLHLKKLKLKESGYDHAPVHARAGDVAYPETRRSDRLQVCYIFWALSLTKLLCTKFLIITPRVSEATRRV